MHTSEFLADDLLVKLSTGTNQVWYRSYLVLFSVHIRDLRKELAHNEVGSDPKVTLRTGIKTGTGPSENGQFGLRSEQNLTVPQGKFPGRHKAFP